MRDAMLRLNIRRLAPLSLALVLAACASADDGTASDPDAITPQELAAGQAWSPSDDTDGDPSADTPEAPLTIATPPEDSASYLDPDDALFGAEAPTPPGEIDLDNLEQTKTCHRATGYRRGKAFTICLTTVDGKYVEVNTARAYLRMRKAARKSGVGIRVVSGFRSMAQQRYLYHCYKTRSCNGGNLAAPPGYSNHQSGHALDLNTSAGGVYSWLANHGRTYGFRRTVPSEKWHWEH